MTHPTPPFDLTKFCNKNHHQPYLAHPFTNEGFVYATNQQIAVRIPDAGYGFPTFGQGYKSIDPTLGEKFKTLFMHDESAPGLWHDPAYVSLFSTNCKVCQGTGKQYKHRCTHCDGEGEIIVGKHSYECKGCDGDGETYTSTPHHDSVECDCRKCLGSGKMEYLVPIGATHIQRKYFQLIKALPNSRIFVSDHEGNDPYQIDAIRFKFDGGLGIVMPLRNGVAL
jgi:hypothetical protein